MQKQCFYNAQMVTIFHPGFQYVEGYAQAADWNIGSEAETVELLLADGNAAHAPRVAGRGRLLLGCG